MDSVIDLSNNWGLLDTGPSRTKRNSCVGATRKASPNWSQETVTSQSSHFFSIVDH